MYWWKAFDKNEVYEDFTSIRDIGLKLVRIFLLWEDFQPKPEIVSDSALSNLGTVLDIADELGLKVIPTFFVGHMSGVNWLPPWLLSDKPHERFLTYSNGRLVDLGATNIYEDPAVLEAEKLLVETVGREFSSHKAIHSWDISNEIDNVLIPRTPEVALKWLSFIYETLKEVSSKPITFGVHQEDIEGDKHFRIPDIAPWNDYLCMHAYSVYSGFTNPLDPYFVPFACVLTRELGNKEVLMEEFGMPTTQEKTKRIRSATGKEIRFHYLINEREASTWLEKTVRLLQIFGCMGAVYWNFSDYHPSLWQKPPFDRAIHERFFGLFRSDGTPKSLVFVLKRLSEDPDPPQRIEPNLNVPENYYSNPKENLKLLYAQFREAVGDDI
ncbi:beta-galactosidase [Thermococcus sp.]|uniref:glycoside hydrolase 5 family protein n=1 Tax=Thermococcus sp. TaxID=35749 RepID=UPI002620CF7E|nr:beta-galactosidase [Thermococcus sp.]